MNLEKLWKSNTFVRQKQIASSLVCILTNELLVSLDLQATEACLNTTAGRTNRNQKLWQHGKLSSISDSFGDFTFTSDTSTAGEWRSGLAAWKLKYKRLLRCTSTRFELHCSHWTPLHFAFLKARVESETWKKLLRVRGRGGYLSHLLPTNELEWLNAALITHCSCISGEVGFCL